MNIEFDFININDWTTIKISGKQILEYLNGIVTFDLLKLKEGQTTKNMFLTPKAKIRSIFWLKYTNSSYLLYCPSVFRDNLIEDLLKFKLDMDVKLEDLTEETHPLYLERSEDPEISLGGLNFKFTNLEKTPENTLPKDRLKEWLIINGELPFNHYLTQNPYEAGLDDAVTLQKGCFLGQEPLSRMYHRGKPRKYLYQIKFPKISDNISLELEDAEVGELITFITSDGDNFGIAYLNSSLTDFSNIQKDGSNITVLKKIGNYPNISR